MTQPQLPGVEEFVIPPTAALLFTPPSAPEPTRLLKAYRCKVKNIYQSVERLSAAVGHADHIHTRDLEVLLALQGEVAAAIELRQADLRSGPASSEWRELLALDADHAAC